MDPRQAKKMMRQLGYKEWEGVEEVIIRTADREVVIRNPGVAEMDTQGQHMFMVTGKVEEAVPGGGPVIPDEDVQLVAERAGVTPEEARQALLEADGEPAEAIIKLMQR
jgi:nascent polypeptide-associated complex subunit alpha